MTRLRTALRIGALAVAAYAVASRIAKRALGRPTTIGPSVISSLHDDTTVDRTGAVRSVQSADVEMPVAALTAIWSPMYLERLARTYWRFLSRCTLGLVRVEYTDDERFVVLLRRPFVLLAFRSPEYEMNADRGVVRWRIARGVLVAPPGVDADGYLEIDARRMPAADPARVRLHVEVEVANYYPRIASTFTQWAYAVTQSRIHVLVTYGFLRSIAKLDLAPSKVGRLAEIADVPDPSGPTPSERSRSREAGRIPSATREHRASRAAAPTGPPGTLGVGRQP
ncbi:MAG TPA: hypothetical protein VMT10_00840 [Solirubrobacteraceae bacterium]|nr:hypothetical protein [Solirubrobacteraceae bacterium]